MDFLKSRMHKLVAFLFVLLVTVPGMVAQTNYGSIRGEVKDSQGASIRGAEVTLTNQETSVARTDVTNATGIYQFAGVDPGTYKVTIAMPGFKKYEAAGNTVSLGATATVDATLQIGATSETVEVTTSSLVLDTASASGGQMFNEQQLTDLPNLGRDPFIFAKLDANVVLLGDPRYVRAEDATGASQVSLAGAPSNSNSYVIDGIPISTSSGGLTVVISPDAVSDAKIQSNAYDAEVGRTGGGVFNNTLKGGSTSYHGVLYGETRQTPWAANLYYDKINPAALAATPDNTTYLYSGAFGGPLPFMKKAKWLDNTFFWVTEEGYRQGQPLVSNTTAYYVPTAAERTGDFSAYAPANGSKTSCTGTTGAAGGACEILYDPTAAFTGAARTVTFLTEYGANKVPASLINPIGQFVANAFPAATTTGIYGGGNNYSRANISFKTRSDEYVLKLDHTFAPWWNSSVSYVHEANQEPAPNVLLSVYASATRQTRYTDSTAWNNTFTLNPTTFLTAAYGFNRYYSSFPQYSGLVGKGFNAANGFGGAGFNTAFASLLQAPNFPAFSFSNITSGNSPSLGGAQGGPTIQASHNLVLVMTKTLGRHNVKAGYAYRGQNYYTNPTSGGSGTFGFTGQFSNVSGTSTSTNGSLAVADLLEGLPGSGGLTLNSGVFINTEGYHALFVQDDFRLSQKLTVNIGLRYEYELGQSEQRNRYNVGFSPTATSTYTGASAGAPTVTAKGGLLFAGVGTAPTHCCDNSHTKFSPRVGLAYQAMKNTVFHGGFGVFFAPVGISPATAGYSQASTYAPGSTTAATTAGPNAYLTSPFPTGVLLPTGNTLGALTSIGSSISSLQDFGRRFPLVEQYSVDMQQQLPFSVLVKVSYIGAHARNFANSVNINQLSDSVLASYAGGTNNLATKVANPYYATTIGGLPATGVVATSTVAQGQLLLPFPQFGSVTVAKSNGYSHYNSLALKAEKRVRKGLTVLATYTWGANWDNLYGTSSQIFSNNGPQDSYNPKGEYSRSINSIPNRETAAITYVFPVGRGQKFLGSPSGFIGKLGDELLGGWQFNDEWIIQNGVPLSVVQTDVSSGTYGTTGVGGSVQRPNLIGDVHAACGSGRPQGRLGNAYAGYIGTPYIKVGAFTAAAPYTYGNSPRMLPCRAPGQNQSDISLDKSFSIAEKVKFQFRAEFLNAFNTPQFGTPTQTISLTNTAVNTAPTINPVGSTQNFGSITTQVGFSRIIQLGGRITF